MSPETIAAYLNDTASLQDLLLYHAIGDDVVTSDDAFDGKILPMANGQDLSLSISDEGAFLVFPTGQAQIIRGDFLASNGVLHLIDTLLAPPLNCSTTDTCPEGQICDTNSRRRLLFGYQTDANYTQGICKLA